MMDTHKIRVINTATLCIIAYFWGLIMCQLPYETYIYDYEGYARPPLGPYSPEEYLGHGNLYIMGQDVNGRDYEKGTRVLRAFGRHKCRSDLDPYCAYRKTGFIFPQQLGFGDFFDNRRRK